MKVKTEIIEFLKTTCGTRTSVEIAVAIDRPAPTVRRALAQMKRAGTVVLYDDKRPHLYVAYKPRRWYSLRVN